MSTIRKSIFLKQCNFEPLKGQKIIAAKLNRFTVFWLQDQTAPYSSWQARENIFLFKKVSIYKVYSMIQMNRTHLFLTVNTNTSWKAEFHLTISESRTIWLPIEFHGFTSRINSKGYHSLVLGLISIFLETVWVPLNYIPKARNI